MARCQKPYLIGVRHHSAALSVAMPELLAAADPRAVLVELPAEFAEWLPWLATEATTAPVALSGAGKDGGLAFYPFADFSPELVAIRWAIRHGVEVRPCDLPLSMRGDYQGNAAESWLVGALRQKVSGRESEDLWDRLVEAPAPGQPAEAVRRAALAVGWALRQDVAVDAYDLRREAWMRRCVEDVADHRTVAVIGSFHAMALMSGDLSQEAGLTDSVVTSLVPYAFDLLDERSGYPAGIRDPEWQQAIFRAGGDPMEAERVVAEMAVKICAGLRARGHPAGPGEAGEVVRLALDVARLRGLPAPGRGELVEAVQTVLTQGEPVGRGRVVAQVAGSVLVGNRSGSLAPGTPRSGLAPAVEAALAELRLPGPAEPRKRLRLDPLRSTLDRKREIALHRLDILAVPYATFVATEGIGPADAITTQWDARWTPATAAILPVAGIWGVTLAQAAAGRLRAHRVQETESGGSTAIQVIDGLRSALRCDLPTAAATRLADAATVLPASGGLADLLAGLELLDRLRAGHFPVSADILPAGLAERLEASAVAQVDGLAGSDEVADAAALIGIGQRAAGLRLAAALKAMAANGSPLMQGAAAAARVLLGREKPAALGERTTSWLDTATTGEARVALARRLTGVLVAAEPLLEIPEALTPLMDRVESLPDKDFLARLPALRGGFRAVGPAARDRILEAVGKPALVAADPEALAGWIEADRAGWAAVETTFGPPARTSRNASLPAPGAGNEALRPTDGRTWDGELPPAVRWQLVLGRHGDRPQGGARYAAALDELYGGETGEGARPGGGQTPFPDAREWSAELVALFGNDIREEVLAAAAEDGRLDAALELDPATVRPSVELLRNVLALAGGLPESALGRLRPLVAKMVAELTARLATRLRPALTGLQLPRPSRRPGGRLDLDRTLRANLATARRRADGTVLVVPERAVFRTRMRKANEWRLVLVVDVSGSMESSTVWAALTAAILAGVPMLTTHFLAFSTEVVDLSGRVSDPLALLLEVSVGGGTHIAGALRHARTLITVPDRTMVVVVSDFEEGGPPGALVAEVRELVASGVRVLGCASLDDTGAACYSVAMAGSLVAAGMPVAALSPQQLASWVGEQVR